MSLVDYANEEEDNSPPHESELGADGAMNDDTLVATSADSETSAHTHNNTRAINEVDSKEDPHEDALASVAAYELAEEPQAPTLQSPGNTASNTSAPPAVDYSAWGPPPPSTAPDPALVSKISNFHEFKRAGKSLNRNLRRAKDFKNPELLTTLVQFVGIDEIGTNYAQAVWDPHRFAPSDYYKQLDQEQQQLVNAKTAPSTAKSTAPRTSTAPSTAAGTKRKSQWDLNESAEPKKQRK